ncbi:hypothetical protein ACSQ67_013936 [Phaseolus vulgaris]
MTLEFRVRVIYGGGVTSMPSFLQHFFPDVYKKIQEHGVDGNYCKYDNQTLQLFTSSLYLAALVATIFASGVTRKLGRKHTMLIAGVFFIVGTVLNSVVNSLSLLILGRLLLGCGVGFANQGRLCLKKIRGVENVEPSFGEILKAGKTAKMVKNPFKNLIKRHNRPPLIMIFQQFTGINAIMFYAPVLFGTLGFKSDASLCSAVITGAVNVLSTLVSVYFVDKVGRRILLLEACVQMFVSRVVIGIVLGMKVQDHSESLNTGFAVLVVVMVCTFVSSFAWSWGPLGWLIPSETFPLEARSARQSVTVFMNMLFTFIIAQGFLVHDVPLQVWHLLLLLRLGACHVIVHNLSSSGDQEYTH